MENFTNRWKWSISIVAIGLFSLCSCGDAILSEDLQESQELARKSSSVNFSGCIIDPLTCYPVEGAVVTSGETTVTTDADGKFSSIVEESLLSNTVSVEKDGHVPYSFAVDYDQFEGDIRIDLPTTQVCVWIGPNEGAWYKVTTNEGCVTYRIDILRGSIDRWTEICVGPGGNAYGAGIDGFFAQPSISIDAPLVDNIEFLKPVDVRYSVEDLITAADKSTCLAAGSSLATPGLKDLTDLDDILAALFGENNSGRVINEELVSFSPVVGTTIPGVGIIGTDPETGESVIFTILPNGTIGEICPFVKNGTIINFPGTPHQSVADGNG